MPTVLLSAPYMLRVWKRVRPVFEAFGVQVLLPQVRERLSEDELLAYAGQFDGALCGDDRFTARVLEACAPRLKVIAKWGTGVDSIDREAARRLGIAVYNTPDAFTEPVADTVMGFILAFARRIPWLDARLKAGHWEKTPALALHETTLGVIGVGNIGRAVLRRARAFGMRLLGNDIRPVDPEFVREVGVELVPLEELLRRSDFVSVNCDLNPSSYHLINRERLRMMKPSAVLINTARGSVVDEAALVEALEMGWIAGAALDVFEEEPLPANSPLRRMPNVLLSPHNANASPAAWERVHWSTLRKLWAGLGLDVEALEVWEARLQLEGKRGVLAPRRLDKDGGAPIIEGA